MTGLERRWLALVFEAILPDGVSPGFPGMRQVPLASFLDDFESAAPGRMLAGVRLALAFVFLGAPLVFLGRLRTFAGLAPEDRLELLKRLRASDVYVLRELPVLLKSVACLAHGGLPEVQRQIGIPWEGPPPVWARPQAPGERAP